MKHRSVQNVNRSDVGTVINEQVVWNYLRGVVVLCPSHSVAAFSSVSSSVVIYSQFDDKHIIVTNKSS